MKFTSEFIWIFIHGKSNIPSLTFGWFVYVYIDVPDGTPILLQETKVPIRALRFLSPVVNDAVKRNGWDADLDRIALPSGDGQAYLDILRWLDDSLLTGYWKLLTVTGSNRLFALSNALDIAEKLRIDALIGRLHRQLDGMLHLMIRVRHFIPTYDVYELYRSGKYNQNYPLRRKLARVLAEARKISDMPKQGKGRIRKLVRNIEELQLEMVASQRTFESSR